MYFWVNYKEVNELLILTITKFIYMIELQSSYIFLTNIKTQSNNKLKYKIDYLLKKLIIFYLVD